MMLVLFRWVAGADPHQQQFAALLQSAGLIVLFDVEISSTGRPHCTGGFTLVVCSDLQHFTVHANSKPVVFTGV